MLSSDLPDLEIAAAAFDTRIDAPAILTGRAAKGIDSKLHDIGCRRAADPESFLVTTENRLVDGEVDRARAWGSKLADRHVTTGNQSWLSATARWGDEKVRTVADASPTRRSGPGRGWRS